MNDPGRLSGALRILALIALVFVSVDNCLKAFVGCNETEAESFVVTHHSHDSLPTWIPGC
jgi:hypothetical protein